MTLFTHFHEFIAKAKQSEMTGLQSANVKMTQSHAISLISDAITAFRRKSVLKLLSMTVALVKEWVSALVTSSDTLTYAA